jgi:hypothetical protein
VCCANSASALGGRQRQGEIAARIGGDEFALLMTNVASPTAASVRADQLLAVIREPLASVGFPLAIAASVGVSAWPDDGADAATLIQAADLAMYAAKRSGNSVQVSRSGGGPSEVGRLTLLAELQAGLAHGEPHPVVPAATRSRHGTHHRRRSTDSLEAPPARDRHARPLHHARRAHRPDGSV